MRRLMDKQEDKLMGLKGSAIQFLVRCVSVWHQGLDQKKPAEKLFLKLGALAALADPGAPGVLVVRLGWLSGKTCLNCGRGRVEGIGIICVL